jgi:hypothetical protein
VSPVKYELDFYISEDDILHSDRRENLKSYRRSTFRPVSVVFRKVAVSYITTKLWRQRMHHTFKLLHISPLNAHYYHHED